MIDRAPHLTEPEHEAVRLLLDRLLRPGEPPIVQMILFGSKARGDFDRASDVDLLLICDVSPEEREYASERVGTLAEEIFAATGVELGPWAVSVDDLEEGARTPMLVDALEDGVPLWPRGARVPAAPYTPADARFCADCLLDWTDEGGGIVADALAEGRWAEAAERARDDITRMATAALLLTGETRHRRQSSLRRFEQRFVGPRLVSPRVLPALAWARSAYPPDGGRGEEHPEVPAAAVETADRGQHLAAVLEAEIVPWIIARLRRLDAMLG